MWGGHARPSPKHQQQQVQDRELKSCGGAVCALGQGAQPSGLASRAEAGKGCAPLSAGVHLVMLRQQESTTALREAGEGPLPDA